MASPDNVREGLLKGTFDLVNDTVKVALGGDNTSYTFDAANHVYVNDVFDGGGTGEELSDATYSRQSLANKSVSLSSGEGVWDGDDVTFSGLDTTQDIQFIVVYQEVTDDTDSPILVVYDDDSAGSLTDLPLPTNGSDVTVSWNASGIINLA